MNQYEEMVAKLKNEPLPELGKEWRMPNSNKQIFLKVIKYNGDKSEVLTVHSNWLQLRTEHWIKKMYWKSRQEFGNG